MLVNLPPEEDHRGHERDIPTYLKGDVKPPKGPELRFFESHDKERQATRTVYGVMSARLESRCWGSLQPLYRDVLW
jgi:hypothetical protein